MAKLDNHYTVSLDFSEVNDELDKVLDRIRNLPLGEFEELTVEEFEFPWWTFVLSAFIGALMAFGVLWVLVLVFA